MSRITRIKFLALVFVTTITSSVYSQQVTWAHNIGSYEYDISQGSHVDEKGNVYICGEFRGKNVDFDPSFEKALHSSNGLSDGFMAEFSSTGKFIRCITIGGTGLDKINAISTDKSGNIYMTGFFRGSKVDFDPSASTAYLSSNGENGSDPGYGGDIFIAKYSSDGKYLWAYNIGGSSLGDNGIALSCDTEGNIFLGGYFKTIADFDPSSSTKNLNPSNGTAFLAKYNFNGDYLWAFNFGQSNDDNTLFDIELDASNNVFITGFFQGKNIDFDPSSEKALLTAKGNYEAYLAKYNSSGKYQFAFKIGGDGLDTGRGITIDNAGNVYIVGDFNGLNVDFDPATTTANLSSNGSSDIFISKYDNNGKYLWAFNAGSSGAEIGWKIGTDNKNLYISGGFSGKADFNPSKAVDNLTSNGGTDIFLAKYTLDGEYQCAFNVGSSGNDYGFDIVVAGVDQLYISGGFLFSDVDFAPTQATYLMNSKGNSDIFLAKYLWTDNILPTGVLKGSKVRSNEIGQLTYTSLTGTSPFTIVYSDGVKTYTQTNIENNVPFSVQPTPTKTTNFSVVSIQDAVRCSPPNTNPNQTATIKIDNTPRKTLRGNVFDSKTKKTLKSTVEISGVKNKDEIILVETDESGNFEIEIVVGLDYMLNVSKKGYLFFSDNFWVEETTSEKLIEKNVPLIPIEANASLVLKNVFFDVNKYELKNESITELNKLVQLLIDNPTVKIEIGGHTDNTGKPADNLVLSNNRAKSVVTYLTSKGIAVNRLTSKGYGETKPIADNNTEEGRAMNRRTEMKVTAQ